MKLLNAVAAVTLAVSCSWSLAAAPSAVFTTPGFSFDQYTGSTAVGTGAIATPSVLYYIDEQTVGDLKSWYVFFEPGRAQQVDATLTFDSPIMNVFSTQSQLASSDSTYGVDVDGDSVFDDYATSHFIAPEPSNLRFGDSVSWTPGSNSLTLHFGAWRPGDHIRVLVSAVPEPSSYALMGVGLLGVYAARRRRGRKTAV